MYIFICNHENNVIITMVLWQTHALEHMMYGYTLFVPMNQIVLNKLSKEHNISGHK